MTLGVIRWVVRVYCQVVGDAFATRRLRSRNRSVARKGTNAFMRCMVLARGIHVRTLATVERV